MILNSNDLRNVRPIAENINDPARLEPYIREAETLRLVDAIGANLYRWLDETDFSGPGPFQYGDVTITKISTLPPWKAGIMMVVVPGMVEAKDSRSPLHTLRIPDSSSTIQSIPLPSV